MFYGDKDKAAALAGISGTLLTDEMLDVINTFIDTEINNNKSFGIEYDSDEYYDITNNTSELVIKKFPIVSITSVTEGGINLVETTDYVVDYESGIIKKLTGNFEKGFHIIRVVYSYGYTTIPSLIVQIATMMAAKWGKIKHTQADADGLLKSVKMGDYSESYDLSFMGIKSEFDEMLDPMIKRAIVIYSIGV